MGKHYSGIDLIELVVRSVDNELLEVLFLIFIVHLKFPLWRLSLINYNTSAEVIFFRNFLSFASMVLGFAWIHKTVNFDGTHICKTWNIYCRSRSICWRFNFIIFVGSINQWNKIQDGIFNPSFNESRADMQYILGITYNEIKYETALGLKTTKF